MGLALPEAVERLQSPDACEDWSALTGASVLAVDAVAGTRPLAEAAVAVAITRLAEIPCPSVVVVDPGASTPEALCPLLGAFDVVVANGTELAEVERAVARRPHAAAVLVHVLRAGRTLGVVDALRVESMAYATLQAGPEHAEWLASRKRTAQKPAVDRPSVTVERDGGTLIVTLTRPERHNAYSARMRDGLTEALVVAASEPHLAVVLRGAGPSFCSGGDLDEFGTSPDPATAHLVRATRSPARQLAALGSRVRAEVHGACIGAGTELAAFAGRVVAAPDAFFQLPEVAMGLIPGAGGTASLPRRIGWQRTALLALTGRRVGAATARDWGLVDAVVDGARLP